MYVRLRGPNNFTKIYIEPEFPWLADEIDQPSPDMNIKAAVITVSKKSINTPKQKT